MPRLYVESEVIAGVFQLPERAAKHVQVLRKQPGDILELFNGSGRVVAVEIVEMGKKSVSVRKTGEYPYSAESTLPVVLLQSVSGSERMDWTIQKSVELGVTAIYPILSERSSQKLSGERAKNRVARWQEIAVGACEQSGRTVVPRVADIVLFSALSALPEPIPASYTRLLLDPEGGSRLGSINKPTGVAILIGPEGGFSDAEKNSAHNAGFSGITLGPRVLRTETASAAALAAVQTLWGDFG